MGQGAECATKSLVRVRRTHEKPCILASVGLPTQAGLEHAKCVLHHVAREVHRALCRIPALVHDDRDKVASARMLRVRRDILRGRVSKRRAHIYGNAPLPRQ